MKVKECAKCRKSGNIMYRVKIDATKNWFFYAKIAQTSRRIITNSIFMVVRGKAINKEFIFHL